MINITSQEKEWGGEHGRKYTIRNPQNPKEMDELYLNNFGVKRSKLNKEFLGNLDRSFKILEVGCNIGVQLSFLQKMGFKNLYGIEINPETIERGKSITKNINFVHGSALDVPFKDNYFDLVFTSGVLIHISPKNIGKVMEEIYRCTKKYIWGCEYSASKYTAVNYRGKKNMLWKADFSKIYLEHFKDLKMVKERKIKYLGEENEDSMFLLRKKNESKNS